MKMQTHARYKTQVLSRKMSTRAKDEKPPTAWNLTKTKRRRRSITMLPAARGLPSRKESPRLKKGYYVHKIEKAKKLAR
jgi:hypothetical protein